MQFCHVCECSRSSVELPWALDVNVFRRRSSLIILWCSNTASYGRIIFAIVSYAGGVSIRAPHYVPVLLLPLTTSLQNVACHISVNVLITVCCIYVLLDENIAQVGMILLWRILPIFQLFHFLSVLGDFQRS